jgi:hypothetical protein
MNKKLRTRDTKNKAQLLILKMLPLLFMILLYMMATATGIAAPNGPIKPGMQ